MYFIVKYVMYFDLFLNAAFSLTSHFANFENEVR